MRATCPRTLLQSSRFHCGSINRSIFRHGLRLRPFPSAPFNGVPTCRTSLSSQPRQSSREFHHTSQLGDFKGLGVRHRYDSTIFALSTAPGRAAIAIVRLSGPACLEVYRRLCPNKPPPKPRQATLRTLYDPSHPPSQSTILDPSALLLHFPSPNTLTGEDILELHLHGSPAILRAVLSALPKCHPSLRPADPGEFTRRAFSSGRLDLTHVEALGDILASTTEQQRRLAVRGATADLAQRYDAWRGLLLAARGELEALIDFSEDQHFDEAPVQLAASVAAQVRMLQAKVQAHLRNAVRGEMLRNGISLALLGAPNAGKSSLLNCIVGREAAIVSAEAGTTRDVVEVGLDLGGYYCRFGDMAGLRRGAPTAANPDGIVVESVVGAIEKEGIKRAKMRALEADVVVVVCAVEPAPEDGGGGWRFALDEEVRDTARQCIKRGANVVVAVNKMDNIHDPGQNDTQSVEAAKEKIRKALHDSLDILDDNLHFISCKEASQAHEQESPTPDPGNIQAFLRGTINLLKQMTDPVAHPDSASLLAADDGSMWDESLGATERHRLLLEDCLQSLDAFLDAVSAATAISADVEADADAEVEVDIVAAAECLRAAADCLARITGRGEAGDVEEVLGVVFEKFCVGK